MNWKEFVVGKHEKYNWRIAVQNGEWSK